MYDRLMPQAGFMCVLAKIGPARQIVEFLIEADDYATNGSSWAITTDCASGYRKVWLSQASVRRLIKDSRFRPFHEGLREMLRTYGTQ